MAPSPILAWDLMSVVSACRILISRMPCAKNTASEPAVTCYLLRAITKSQPPQGKSGRLLWKASHRMNRPDMGHTRCLVPISELLQRKSRQVANLRQEEVIAIVLCTGPVFQIYNTSLRRYPKEDFELFEKRDNLFCTTVFALVSAVQKLSRFTRIPS